GLLGLLGRSLLRRSLFNRLGLGRRLFGDGLFRDRLVGGFDALRLESDVLRDNRTDDLDLLAGGLVFDLGLGRSGTTPTAGLDDAALTLSAPGLDEALSAPGFDEPGTALAALGRDLGARFDALTTAPGGSAGGEVGLGGDAIARQGRRLDDLTLVDPDLDADRADGRVGGGGAEVDVCAQGVERNPAFAVPLAASHLGATEAALGFDSHAFGARLHGGGDGTLHRPAERDPV